MTFISSNSHHMIIRLQKALVWISVWLFTGGSSPGNPTHRPGNNIRVHTTTSLSAENRTPSYHVYWFWKPRKRLWLPNSGQSIFWCDWSHFGLVPCKDSSATSLCVWINLSYQSFVTCRYRSCGRYGNWRQADTLSPCNYHLLALIFRISHKNLTLILMRIYSFLLKISLNLGAWIVICQNNRMFACL